MQSPNPYQSPQAELLQPQGPGQRPAFTRFLPAFFSGVASVPMLFLAIGTLGNRFPDFILEPAFIGTLVACAALSAVVLWPLHRTHWVVRALLAIPTTILLFVAVMVGLRLFAG